MIIPLARWCLHPYGTCGDAPRVSGLITCYLLSQARKTARFAPLFLVLVFFLIGLRQAKIVDGDPCSVYNVFIIHNRSIRSGLTNLLNFPAPIVGEDHRLHKLQLTNNVPGVGVPPRVERYRPGEYPLSFPNCWSILDVHKSF